MVSSLLVPSIRDLVFLLSLQPREKKSNFVISGLKTALLVRYFLLHIGFTGSPIPLCRRLPSEGSLIDILRAVVFFRTLRPVNDSPMQR